MAKRGASVSARAQMASRDADILVKIAIVFTLINSAIVLSFLDKVVETAKGFGIATTPSNWILLSVAWIFLSFFAYIANSMTRSTNKTRPMWGLLLVGVLFLVTGRVESAILVGIAALLYLYRDKSKR